MQIKIVHSTQAVTQGSRLLLFLHLLPLDLGIFSICQQMRKEKEVFMYSEIGTVIPSHIPLSKNKSQSHAKGVWKLYSGFAQEEGDNMEIGKH